MAVLSAACKRMMGDIESSGGYSRHPLHERNKGQRPLSLRAESQYKRPAEPPTAGIQPPVSLPLSCLPDDPALIRARLPIFRLTKKVFAIICLY